jgi:hypothetical protein
MSNQKWTLMVNNVKVNNAKLKPLEKKDSVK